MCSNGRLSREDLWTVRGNLGGRRTSASSSKRARLWGAWRPRYRPNGSGAGSDGNTDATQRMRGDRARCSADLSSSLLKNLEMESCLILTGRCWGGAVELDVIF